MFFLVFRFFWFLVVNQRFIKRKIQVSFLIYSSAKKTGSKTILSGWFSSLHFFFASNPTTFLCLSLRINLRILFRDWKILVLLNFYFFLLLNLLFLYSDSVAVVVVAYDDDAVAVSVLVAVVDDVVVVVGCCC